MQITEKQKYQLKKFIKELEQHRGRHTELVSVYIPKDYDIIKIINHLEQEKGTAANIKSASTRKNVIDALEKMVQHLRLYKKTPENGLAVFSGNVTKREGQQDFQVWSIEPPLPLKTRIYRCDKEFVLDLLKDMLEIKEIYGLVIVDRRDANIAYLKGKTIIPLVKTHSQVPGKTRAGGQSAARFERLREGAKKDHFKKVAEYMKEQFLKNKNLKGIIVGGPGPTKHDFIDSGHITTEVKKKIIATKDLSYTGDFGLQELVEKSQDILAKEEITAEKKIVGKFLEILSTKPGRVSYGVDEVMKNLKLGAVDIILLSEKLEDKKLEEFESEAKKMGTEIKIISTETREGAQLVDMGKVAAILRYEVGNS
jgi:peptide chain release factor subunit 1